MWPVKLAFLLSIVSRICLSSLILFNTSSLLTRMVQSIVSILLQHHISKHSWYFWRTFPNVHVSGPYSAMIKMLHFTSFFLKFKANLLVKKSSSCWMLLLPWQSWIQHDVNKLHHVIMLPQQLEYSTFSHYFWSITICTGDGSLEILITLILSTFISNFIYPTMPCSPLSA